MALWNSLEGPALELVAGNAPANDIPTLEAMVELLTARFAPVGLNDQMLGTLLQRRQKPGEKWMDYCDALTQIYNAANPTEGDTAERRKLLHSAFLAGVCDTHVLMHLRVWCSGQRGIPLLADAAKYCASIAGPAPERCDRFVGEPATGGGETTTDQYRDGPPRGGRNCNRGRGS